MRWLSLLYILCTIPVILSCSDPIGPTPNEGSINGKNDEVVLKNAATFKDLNIWDVSAAFTPDGRLDWSVKKQNINRDEALALALAISIYPDSLRTEGTELIIFSNRNVDLGPLEQKTITYLDPTSLNPPPSTYYWTFSWSER